MNGRRWMPACALVLSLAPPAAPAAEAPVAVNGSALRRPAAVPQPAAASQSVHGDQVLIEGKLYSPQALYILTRVHEPFGRDAIVPRTLVLEPTPAFLPYRLREEKLQAARAAVAAPAASDSTSAAPPDR